MERKLILDEKTNTITERGFSPRFNALGNEVNKFDNTYNASKVRDILNEFDSISVNEKDYLSTTYTKNNAITKSAVSYRVKLYLASAVTVMVLMLFLAIYNIFVINSMQNGIEMLQGDVLQQEQRWSEVYGRYKNLTQTDNIMGELENSGYVPMDESNMFYVNLENAKKVTPLTGETNWFDALCNFISNLFVN